MSVFFFCVAIGELAWFAVQKCTVTAVATTVALNTLSKKVNTVKIIKKTSLDNLRPGMKIDLTISKVNKKMWIFMFCLLNNISARRKWLRRQILRWFHWLHTPKSI